MSSFSTKRKNLLCLRFDTCFHGHYFEIYYIFVKLLKKDKVVPKIVAHTLPSFLPLDEWERECLSTDLPVIVSFFIFPADLHAVRFSSSQQLHRPSRAVQSRAGSVPLVGIDGFDGLHARFDRFRAFPTPTRLFRRFAPSPQRGTDGERGCGVVSARRSRANQSFIAAQVGFRASRFVGSVVRLDFVTCFFSNPLNCESTNQPIKPSESFIHSFIHPSILSLKQTPHHSINHHLTHQFLPSFILHSSFPLYFFASPSSSSSSSSPSSATVSIVPLY